MLLNNNFENNKGKATMRVKNIIALLISFLIIINITNAEMYLPNNWLNPTGTIYDNNIVTSQDTYYEYEMIGIYEAYFNDNPTQAQVIKFILTGTEITFQPMALNWRNDLNQLQQINMIQSVTGTPSNNIFSYDNAYGTGIHLTYITEETQIKERLWINQFSDLTNPEQYIIDGGNPYLELNFLITTNAQHIIIEGTEWDKETEKTTTNPVYIKDDNGKTLYYLPKPIATDNNGDTINLTYHFKESANKLYISIGTPLNWLQNANYPIFIDPTFIADYTPKPAKHLYRGDVEIYNDDEFQSTSDITTHMSDNLTNVSYVSIDSGDVGQAISGAFTQTYTNNGTKWFLRIYKTNLGSSGTPHICAYNDTNNISTNCSTYAGISGIGWHNLQINSQLDYQKNVLGLNYTKIRFYTESTTSWAEMRLRKEYNDTQPPIIQSCWINNATIGCNGIASWHCNITDDLDVDKVNYTISETNYSATQNNPPWYLNITFNDTNNVNETLTLTDIYAYDIFQQLNHSNFSLSIQHICQDFNCTENWIATYGDCLTNDTQLKTYIDNNSCGTNNTLPIDNGTYIPCDYCLEDLEATIGECTSNSTQNVTYNDNNYFTCCLITGLPSDCSILQYPYNTTTTQSCTYYINDFNCTYDTTPILNNKINVICELPDNKTYCCVINIYQNQNLLATTPEYQDASQSLINLKSEEETRTCFTPNQKLVNAYYTKKELRPNTNYKIEILCTTNTGTTIKSQGTINPEYHTYDWLPHRIISIGDKPVLTILTTIAIILIFLLIIWAIKKIREK